MVTNLLEVYLYKCLNNIHDDYATNDAMISTLTLKKMQEVFQRKDRITEQNVVQSVNLCHHPHLALFTSPPSRTSRDPSTSRFPVPAAAC